MESFTKPSRTFRKMEQQNTRRARQARENKEKGIVRRRDRFCRFPMCGCRRLGLALEARPEASHNQHKGMGGNPTGDRSIASGMILLCRHRHQDGAVSRHKGTLRARALTPYGMDGPIAWQVDSDALFPGRYTHVEKEARWMVIAREDSRPQNWIAPNAEQLEQLKRLAEMTL